MHRSGKVKAFLVLILTLLTAGCLANATPEVTYKSQYTDCNIVFTGDGKLDDGITDDTYVWTSPDGRSSGNWYKDGNVIYLQMGSVFNDLPLIIDDDTLTWPNGSVWVKV